MRSTVRLLMLVGLLGAVALAASPDAPPTSAPQKEEPLQVNKRLLEKWKADPDRNARLQRDLDAFWSMPAARRERLRQLDRELHHEDSASQQRLWTVLERYHVWLERLDPEQRQLLSTLPASIRANIPVVGSVLDEQWLRLAVVKMLLDEQWVKQQPLPVQNKINALSGGERTVEIAHLREEQRQRQRDATQIILGPGIKPRKERMPAQLKDYPEKVKSFVNDSLVPLLTDAERAELREAEKQPWPASARKILQLAEKHPIPLPGPIGPTRLSDLPQQLQERLKKSPRAGALLRSEGKWPEFGEALLMFPFINRPNVLPDRFTPKSAADFSDELKEFIARIEKDPQTTEAQLKQLKNAEGKWPDYPRAVLDVAQQKKLTVPGTKLPVIQDLWERATTALPEVPAHILAQFLMNELTPEERKRLAEESGDPMGREWIKKEFFRRKPNQLKKYQMLDGRPMRAGNRPRDERPINPER